MKSVLVLGGYGNFGKRIVEDLANLSNITIYIAGRNIDKAKTLQDQLASTAKAELKRMALDITHKSFPHKLKALSPDLVIHTGGPFQGQDFTVPKACLNAGSHYVDLSDDRRFVCDITQFNKRAQEKELLLVSGASSVPGLSSAVINYYKSQFLQINAIDVAIAPGNKAERGEATVRGILSYTGRPFKVFNDSRWVNAYGWMNPKKLYFGSKLKGRWLANVDVPDLELFPKVYNVKNSVTFQAGLELPLLHWSMIAMAYMTKIGLVKNWAPLTKGIVKLSNAFKTFGTDKGGMNVAISGLTKEHKEITINWTLFAPNGVGPYIPTLSTLIIVKKLLSDKLSTRGAKPCIGLYELEDFLPYAQRYNLHIKEQQLG